MDELINDIIEATAADIRRKHRSIKRLFPDFDAKTKGVEDMGGLRLVDQDASTWKFQVHSGTKNDVWYDDYLHFKNVKPTLEKLVKDRRLWVRDKTKVDLRKLATAFMKVADIQVFCSCPAFQYWGPAYILSLSKYDAKYTDDEHRPPRVRNPKKYGALCKHFDRVMKVLPFYGSTLAKWIKDFYAKDIEQWELEAMEEFDWAKRGAAALAKKRKPKEIEPPEVEEPEEPVRKAMVKAIEEPPEEVEPEEPIAKPDEEPVEAPPEEEEPEEPKVEPAPEPEEPEEEEPEKRPRRRRPKIEKPKPEWKPDAGEKPEEEYF
jgi:hypothetical protein